MALKPAVAVSKPWIVSDYSTCIAAKIDDFDPNHTWRKET